MIKVKNIILIFILLLFFSKLFPIFIKNNTEVEVVIESEYILYPGDTVEIDFQDYYLSVKFPYFPSLPYPVVEGADYISIERIDELNFTIRPVLNS